MTSKITLQDFRELAASLKPTLVSHEVPIDLQDSLLSDVVFQFASFIDEKTGSSFHESIYDLLEECSAADDGFTDYLAAELEIRFVAGRRCRANLLHSMLLNPDALRLQIEMSLGLRSILELDIEIDVEARFAKLLQNRQGIAALEVHCVNPSANESAARPQPSAKHSGPVESIDALCACVRELAGECL